MWDAGLRWEVGGGLTLHNNLILADVTALHDLPAVPGDFTVTNNGWLYTSEATALRDAIGVANIGGTVTISGNAAG